MTTRPLPNNRAGVQLRVKRNSLHLEVPPRKRRKADQPSTAAGSRSPLVHNTTKQTPIPPSIPSFTHPGLALLIGSGDTGQLGLGPDILERTKPARFNAASLEGLQVDVAGLEQLTVQVCAGGMHTACLTVTGRVFTFGCNDEGALGRNLTVSADEETSLEAEKAGEERTEETEDVVMQDESLNVMRMDETRPAYVPLPSSVKIIMITAGDSHTAALDSEGQVWLWGTFRSPNGPIGLTRSGEMSMLPRKLLMGASHVAPEGRSATLTATAATAHIAHLTPGARVVKIASGQDHLVCLTDEGRLYTMGCGELGQLGRIAERFARTGGRSGINALLYPTECRVRGGVRFSNAWAGGFATFARCQSTGAIYACGLNNYGQLGLKGSNPRNTNGTSTMEEGRPDEEDEHDPQTTDADEEAATMPVDAARLITDRNEADKSEAALVARQGPLIQFMLTRAHGFFAPNQEWRQFAVGMHHTLALDSLGHVYAVGRPDYGRLGLGKSSCANSVSQPTRVLGLLNDRTCRWIGCGEACSFAVDTTGIAYSWGMSSSQQLGHLGDDDDEDADCSEPGVIKGKQLEDRFVSMIDAGGQHTILLAHSSLSPISEIGQRETVNSVVPIPDTMPAVSLPNENGLMLAKDINQTSQPMEVLTTVVSLPDTQTTDCTQAMLVDFPKSIDVQLVPPVGSGAPQIRRNRRLSPSSVQLLPLNPDSAAASTAGATVHSSVHSYGVSDTSSVGSCASNTSTSSQMNSAKSTDGGGSSRASSFDTYSVQSSVPVAPSTEDVSVPSASSSLMPDPVIASILANNNQRQAMHTNRANLTLPSVPTGPSRLAGTIVATASTTIVSAAQIRSTGMSICSTSSEPGLLTDTISLGSLTASPADPVSGEQSNS